MWMLYVLAVIIVLIITYFILLLRLRDPDAGLRFDFDKLSQVPWKFGKDFLWGSATASHQIEGGCINNNWYKFESALDGSGQPKIKNGQKAGKCCDGWNLYREDARLMKDLGLNSYRFSLEWSKIEPEEGKFDEAALDHYRDVIDDLRANGIEPMVTLHHFTNPLWLEEKGAFLLDDSPEIFNRFVERVVRHLGDRVDLWCTVNEPAIYAVLSYFKGEFPPGEYDAVKAARVYRNLMIAHTRAYHTIKAIKPAAQVGLVVHMALNDPPGKWNLADVLIARMLDNNLNNSHFEFVTKGRFKFYIPGIVNESYQCTDRDTFDFIGLNYYTNHYYELKPFAKDQFLEVYKASLDQRTDMAWAIYPEGLYRSLKLIRSYTRKPIYVTENGIADAKDTRRAAYIRDHLLVLNKAIADGIDVRGYFYWSLLDNFEWAHGFDAKFGLYKVDFNDADRKRTLYDGSLKYREIIEASRK